MSHMHDAILSEPDAFVEMVDRVAPGARALAGALRERRRLVLTGIGTSHHAARLGEHLFRHWNRPIVTAMHAADLAMHPPTLGADDGVIAISHRGNKLLTRSALAPAHERSCLTAIVTGVGGGEPSVADHVIETVAQERSAAHTVSYVGAVAALGVIARGEEPAFDGASIGGALRGALDAGRVLAGRAPGLAGHRRYWIVGAGPCEVTALEIALKIKETSYLQAEGMSVEAMLHGPFQCAEPEDLFIVIAPSGRGQDRAMQLGAQVEAIGAGLLVVTDGSVSRGVATCVVPPIDEPFEALTTLLPLQLLACALAEARSTDPDGFRLDDPRFAAARRLVTL